MKPGQKLILDWLCLWKNPREVRVDESVWTHLSKDFVFCDDGMSSFDSTLLHEGRTPGSNTPDYWIRIPRDEGAVLHFQFAAFERFQMKQAFMRCREWLMKTGPAWEINEKYGITKDDPRAHTEPLPGPWLQGIDQIDTLASREPGLYLTDIQNYFKQHGPAFFESLDIWHVPELKRLFMEQMKRAPQSSPPPGAGKRLIRRATRFMKNRLRFLKLMIS